MERRTALEIKKKIIELLKTGEKSMRHLESKVNTNYQTIRTQVKELEFFGFVEVIEHKKHKINRKPYKTVKLKN